MILDCLEDAAVDTLKLLPFLFITYLLMEYLEQKTEDHSVRALSRIGRLGPLFGGSVGIVPQCGFSAAAASLYSGGVITVGTLLAVFLSTSDEMLPILISESAEVKTIASILLSKMAIGIISGFLIDLIFRKTHMKHTEHHIHDLCEQDHCGCEEGGEGILKPALVHTLHIALFVLIISFALALLVEGYGKEALSSFLSRRKVTGVLLSSLVGLIPNCAASVLLTEMFLKGMLGTGQMMSGLLVSAGVGLLVLFRSNRHLKDNLSILTLLYIVGVLWGLFFEGFNIQF